MIFESAGFVCFKLFFFFSKILQFIFDRLSLEDLPSSNDSLNNLLQRIKKIFPRNSCGLDASNVKDNG